MIIMLWSCEILSYTAVEKETLYFVTLFFNIFPERTGLLVMQK